MPPKEISTTISKLPMIGGVLAALGASLCCIGPFVLLSLGISGAWIGNLSLFEPYRPIFIVAVLVLLGWQGWKVYRPVEACESGTACAAPQSRKRRHITFWVMATVILILVTGTYWIPLIA